MITYEQIEEIQAEIRVKGVPIKLQSQFVRGRTSLDAYDVGNATVLYDHRQ